MKKLSIVILALALLGYFAFGLGAAEDRVGDSTGRTQRGYRLGAWAGAGGGARR